VVALYGGYLVITGDVTPGNLTAILVYLARISGFHTSLAQLVQEVGIGLISAGRLREVLDREREKWRGQDRELPAEGCPTVVLKEVDFGCGNGGNVLSDFSMQVKPGEVVGLVGPSGSGKSTVINLILGLYLPESGEISVGGVPTRRIDLG
jgi:ABC-type bacteriocin/lantibiotic exporter with double-glycine peptidase domain